MTGPIRTSSDQLWRPEADGWPPLVRGWRAYAAAWPAEWRIAAEIFAAVAARVRLDVLLEEATRSGGAVRGFQA